MYYINIFIRIPEGEGNGAKNNDIWREFSKTNKSPTDKRSSANPKQNKYEESPHQDTS